MEILPCARGFLLIWRLMWAVAGGGADFGELILFGGQANHF